MRSPLSLGNFGFPTHLLSTVSPEVVGELLLRLKRNSFGFSGTRFCWKETVSYPWGEVWASSTCVWACRSVWRDMFVELIIWLVLKAFEVPQGIATNTQETNNLGHDILHYLNPKCQSPYLQEQSLLISDSARWLYKTRLLLKPRFAEFGQDSKGMSGTLRRMEINWRFKTKVEKTVSVVISEQSRK